MDLTSDQIKVSPRATKPDFVFYDFAFWVAELGRRPGIKAIREEELAEPPPGYHSTVLMKKHEARSLTTCEEIEGQLCDYIGSQFEKKVFVSGPILPDPATAPLEQKWDQWLSGFQT
ncbi:hypothetical protein RJ641_000145 [Dillenia turbinata]|uniref:Uncharacterized protein n=1 Tax=Dillenia turbinata TaxID=194707 RepID=A0AAN8WE41_9MAGN